MSSARQRVQPLDHFELRQMLCVQMQHLNLFALHSNELILVDHVVIPSIYVKACTTQRNCSKFSEDRRNTFDLGRQLHYVASGEERNIFSLGPMQFLASSSDGIAFSPFAVKFRSGTD